MSEIIFGGGRKAGDKAGHTGESNPDAPKIEFPCRYPVKVLGASSADFDQRVTAVMREHAPDLQDSDIRSVDSSKGRFRSITFELNATGPEQLERLFAALQQVDGVKMVL